MKIYSITTANNKTLMVTNELHLSKDTADKSIAKWIKKTHKAVKNKIESFQAMRVIKTGVAGLNGTDDGSVPNLAEFKSSELDKALEFVKEPCAVVGVLFNTTDGNHIQAALHTFDIDDTAVLVALNPLGHGK